jgi:hypothetical protein
MSDVQQSTTSEEVIDLKTIDSNSVTDTRTPEELEQQALEMSIKTFNESYASLKRQKDTLSLKSLLRVLDAVVSFPLDEKATNRVKRNTVEFEVFMNALACVKSKAFINHIVDKRYGQQIRDELADKAAPVVKEQLQTLSEKGEENGN